MGKEVAKAPTYSKAQLVSFKKYRYTKDLLNAILSEDKQYSIAEVDDIIQKFNESVVK